jgi:hypothetical protein
MMSDACRAYPQLCMEVNAVHFPSLIYAYVVASKDEDGVFESLAFLEILIPFIEDLTWIDPMWVHYAASQWSESEGLVFRVAIQAALRSDEIHEGWWEFAQPELDDMFSKKIFCTSCFAHWISNPAPEASQPDTSTEGGVEVTVASPSLPPPDVLVPILTDLLCLGDLDADLDSSIRLLLLAYLDLALDGMAEYLYDMLQDGCLGEALRPVDAGFWDVASAVRAVLRGPHEGTLVGSVTPL